MTHRSMRKSCMTITEAILSNERIAICGTHGIGKTLLSRYISDTFGYKHIPEIARERLEEKGVWWDRLTKEGVSLFQNAIFYSHMFMIQNEHRFVVDRSILDHMAYVDLHLRDTSEFYPALVDLQLKLWETANNVGNMYDLLIYYSPDGLKLDRVQESIDYGIKFLLGTYAPNYVTVTRKKINAEFPDMLMSMKMAV